MMKRNYYFNKEMLIWSYLCLVFLTAMVRGQDNTVKAPSNEDLEKVYSSVFPKYSDKFSPSKEVYAMDIRIEPSFSAPSQLSIRKFSDGKLEMKRLDFLDRKVNLVDRIISLPNYAQNDLESIIETLKLQVTEKKPKDSASLKAILKTFFGNQSFYMQENLSLDGVAYKIWYSDRGSRFYFFQMGGEKFEKNESPLISFARKILKSSER